MIIAKVDLHIVADTPPQLHAELNLIQERDRAHISGWRENYYRDGRKPRGKRLLDAFLAVTEKLAETKKGKA